MELHSYAKRRASKKWSVEQKRKLVETRIAYDNLFEQQPNQSVAPWKKVVALAKLDDYNVFFVRKQWSNMIEKYKQYKQSRLGNVSTKLIDNEMLEKLTEEWEFFRPIHLFMTRKTTDLHSYALTKQQPRKREDGLRKIEEIDKSPVWHKADSNSSNDRPQAFSSDTNEDYAASVGVKNDHDFYSKKAREQQEQNGTPVHYYADASDDTQESMLMDLTTTAEETVELNDIKYENDLQDQKRIESQIFSSILLQQQSATNTIVNAAVANATPLEQEETVLPEQLTAQIKEEPLDHDVTMTQSEQTPQDKNKSKSSSNNSKKSHLSSVASSSRRLSEREKYYRHKRHFNRRLEGRFDAILNVFGQIVKSEYPSIDVSPLMSWGGNKSSGKNTNHQVNNYVGKMFSSSDEYTSSDAGDEKGDYDDSTEKACFLST